MSFLDRLQEDPRQLTIGFLIVGVLLAAWVYAPGLEGGLYLDSAKLYQLERVYSEKGPDASLEDISFTTGSGRVVSQASFYLNILLSDGLDVGAIKLSNLLIHFVNATLVFVLALQLFGRTSLANRRFLLAGFVTLAWLLSAVNLGSVVYAIQRMNQLATLFTLLALIFYVRLRGDATGDSPGPARLLAIAAGVTIFTALAIGSKENGLLVPVFILLIEFYFYPTLPKVLSHRGVLLAAVALFLVLALLAGLWITDTYWSDPAARPFSLEERLLTQCRILWVYIGQLLVPSSLATGIFQDGYPISTGLFSPRTTALGLVGLLALMVIALTCRDHRALKPMAFGIAFFLGGHLLESTVLPLELYYEHRNYLPSFGLYVALVTGANSLLSRLKPALATGIVAVYCVFFVVVAHEKSVTWSSQERVYDAALARDYLSPRAAHGRAQLYLENGELEPALALLNQVARANPDEALLSRLQILYVHCAAGMPPDAAVYDGLRESTGSELPIEVSQALRNILSAFEQTRCEAIAPDRLLPILASIADRLRAAGKSSWHVDYYIAEFHLLDDPARAATFLERRFLAGEKSAGWMLRDLQEKYPGLDISPEARLTLEALPED